MSDPERLLDDAGTSADASFARSLLSAGRDVGPPANAKAEIWGNLEAILGPLGGGGGSGGPSAPTQPPTPSAPSPPPSIAAKASALNSAAPAAKAAIGLSFGAKLGLGVVALSGLALGAAAVSNRPEPLSQNPATSSMMVAASGESDQPSFRFDSQTAKVALAPAEAGKPEEPSAKPAGELATAPVDDSPVARKNQLLRESAGVKDARDAMAAGNAQKALTILGDLDREIKKGVMGQERAVLRIEALAKSGQRDAARGLAKGFLSRNPTSPYADRVKPYAN